MSGSQRRPHKVYDVGEDPDVRFSLANERTALAWIRTCLGMIATSVGITTLAKFADLHLLLHLLAAALAIAAGLVAFTSVRAWRIREIALRTSAPLPAPTALAWLAGVLLVIAAALAATILVTGR